MSNDERHYNINKLNILFALSSVVLLGALVWMVVDDYSRSWKDYQKDFRTLEIEQSRVKFDNALNSLEKSPEYQELLAQLEEAKSEYAVSCAEYTDAGKETNRLKAQNDILVQSQKFTSAKLDAARYAYETAEARADKNADNLKKELNALTVKFNNLNLAVEKSNKDIAALSQKANECGEHLKSLERQKRSFANQMQIIQMKLSKIDPNEMDFTNRIAQMVRDLPVIDLANPNYKIEQIVLKDITDDVNFMDVPKVDRCITCHLGINNPDYSTADQPYRTHPNLELYLGRESAHPMEEFGCTVCHGGRGRGTDFTSSVHTPSSKDQAKEWKEKYDWHEMHHWDKPMLPQQYVQASCFKCHSDQVEVKGAEKLNLGLHIIEKSGCYSCHTIEKYKDWPKPGPDLTKLASKVSRNWAYRWINDPHSFRHNTWMPAFFNQSNNSDPESKARTAQEIHAISEYLFKNSEEYKKETIPIKGDATRGEELVASVGCLACHQIKPEGSRREATNDALRVEHGPNFLGVGTKTSEKWIYEWIKDPQSYHTGSRMPNLRLSDQEASDIAAYLSSLRSDEFNNTKIPEVNEEILNTIIFEYLVKSKTHEQANEMVTAMPLPDKLEFAGEKLIRHYGCFSCHNIKGIERDKPIGTELTEEGDKSIHRLDFGFVPIDHTNFAWFTQKLKDPRIFDEGRIKKHDEKLRMPNFYFSEPEIEAVVTALLGFTGDKPTAKIAPRTERNINIEQGQKLVRQMNCRGCHIVEGEGGAIQSSVKDWLIKYDNRSETEAQAIVPSFSPPNLVGEGKKVRTKWLHEFIHHPSTIRPWLKVRMPTYAFDSGELNILLKYFSALDRQDFPFVDEIDTSLSPKEMEAAQKLFSADYFDCAKCHIVGNRLPGGSPENWAPNFALAGERLKPEWILEWITDPQSILPGTKMPNYFDAQNFDASGPDDILDGNEHEQIRVLRNYLLTLSGSGEQSENQFKDAASNPEVSKEPPAADSVLSAP